MGRILLLRLSKEIVDHVADLAQIRLKGEERERVASELSRVLEYVAILDGADIEGVEASWHGPRASVTRVDAPRPSLTRAQALANAPKVREGMFQIPRILGEGEEG